MFSGGHGGAGGAGFFAGVLIDGRASLAWLNDALSEHMH